MGMLHGKKKRRFNQRGRFRKRLLAAAVGVAAVGTTVSAAHSLVVPMLIDGTIEERAEAVFTYQNQVSASLASTIVKAEAHGLPLLDALCRKPAAAPSKARHSAACCRLPSTAPWTLAPPRARRLPTTCAWRGRTRTGWPPRRAATRVRSRRPGTEIRRGRLAALAKCPPKAYLLRSRRPPETSVDTCANGGPSMAEAYGEEREHTARRGGRVGPRRPPPEGP